MATETISEVEAAPAAYPAVPSGLSDAAAGIDPAMLWQRIEAYTAHRFAVREVTWIIEGEGHWSFPLTPATIVSAAHWSGDQWEPVTLIAGPYGFDLSGEGPTRIIASVGGGSVSESVNEAYRRLAEYLAPDSSQDILTSRPSASSHSAKLMDHLNVSFDRAPTWIARALQLSGAADMLRKYRRA